MPSVEDFQALIACYRELGRPAVENGSFVFTGELNLQQRAALGKIWKAADALADISLTLKDQQLQSRLNDDFPTDDFDDQDVSITVRVPDGTYQFKSGLDELLAAPNPLNMGIDASNIYLAREDHLFGDEASNQRVIKTLHLSSLIFKLREIANYSDPITSKSSLKIVFIVPSGNGEKQLPIVLEPKITPRLVDSLSPDLSILAGVENQDDAHYEERASVLRVSMFELFETCPKGHDGFDYLVTHWKDLIVSYRKNFDLYITKFCFLKQKREASESYRSLSDKISESFSSITGKLFGLPVSLAVVYAIFNSKSVVECLLLAIGGLMASIILIQVIKEQQRKRLSLHESIELVFESVSQKETFPGEMKDLLEKYTSSLKGQSRYVGRCLWAFRLTAWLPTFGAIALLCHKFPPDFAYTIHIIEYGVRDLFC